MKTPILLILVLILASSLFARQKTDVIVMENGDRLTGEIKGLSEGVLYVSLDYILGTSSLQWSRVASVQSNQLFIVRTADGSVYKGTLGSTKVEKERPVTIEVVEANRNQSTLPRAQVVEIAGTSDTFWHRFNGNLNSGIIYSKGNQNTQYSLGADLEYLRTRWSANASYNSTLSASSGDASAATRNQLNLTGTHLLPWNNYFYAGLGSFLQSSEQNIQLRTSVGGGIGRYLKNTNNSRIAVIGGLAFQNTVYNQSTQEVPTDKIAAALLATEIKFFRFNKTTLSLSGYAFPALNEPGRLFLNTNATYYIKITSDLSWNVSFYGNWDNQPPPHFSGSDYGTSSGLSYTFGLK